ncbi:hypothetical protein Htur_5281 (plasmid) [Haloterrigena turkmenica DSM 5511]|uniref:Uncharacterized protein n=1 Tax=Haloterrigena turkmenica (strain ATCC 51198 / DSM 5511 / JCM 9101 / NCIMB 13204 / VKM B-1734 / 4k) TaxID=543526 RepID=D2S3R1_HALTV|nr:hypothetical protein [Haloterrigena turkmenica]ADB64008.1 hypothetical protein Htur_5281 [Haloterrigena turkmenica DSM 5511]
MSTDYTSLGIRKETKPYFEQAKEAVATELGEEPTADQVVRELVEAYCGGDACGRWLDDGA